MNTRPALRRARSAPLALYIALGAVTVASVLSANVLGGATAAERGREYRLVIESASITALPFWNPWHCGGEAVWQNPTVSLISPVYLFRLAMPFALAVTLNAAVHYCAAVIALFLLLRAVAGIRSPSFCAAVAVALVLTAAATMRLSAPGDEALAILLVPWLAYLVLRPAGDPVRNAVLAALVLVVIVFDGGLLVTPVAVLMLGVVGVGAGLLRRTWTATAASALTIVLGFGIAAPRLLPAALFASGGDVASAATATGGDSADRASRDECDGRFELKRTARDGQAVLYSDGSLRMFGTTVTPNRIEARVAATASSPVPLILNQNFHPGWHSDVGAVVRDAESGSPSVILPAGFAGRVRFQFSPPGFWFGVFLFVISSATAAAAWKWPSRLRKGTEQAWTHSLPVRRAIAAHSGDLAVIAIAVIGFLWIYNRYPYRPTRPDNGWWNFFDQSQYLRSARAFVRRDWSSAEHVYPIGYPVLAVPFVHLLPRDPFLPVNLALFAAFAWLCFRLFRPVIGAPLAAATFFLALILPTEIVTPQHIGHPVWSQFAIPWTTNGVAPLYAGALLAMRFNWSRAWQSIDLLLGLLLGAVVCIRPADALPLGALLAAYGLHRVWHRNFGASALIALGVLLGATPFLLFMWKVYAGGVSPYIRNVGTMGLFTFSNLPQRAYQLLLRSEDTYGEVKSALFQVQPWLYGAVPLAIVWAVADRVVGTSAVLLVLCSWTVYLGYNDFTPFNILRFFLLHYFVWALPIVAAAAIAGGLDIIRKRRWRAAVLSTVATVLLVGVRLAPSRIAGSQISDEPLACCGVRYTVGFPSLQSVDAVDIVVAVPRRENIITLSQKDINLVVDSTRFDVLSGYQVLRRPNGLRIIFKGKVAAQRVAFTLDEGFERVSDAAVRVIPIRFGVAWRFWGTGA